MRTYLIQWLKSIGGKLILSLNNKTYKAYGNSDTYKCEITKNYLYLAFREWWGAWSMT